MKDCGPYADEEQSKRSLKQGHGAGERFLSWALVQYRSERPELTSRCLGDPAASSDCVHIATSFSSSPTGLSFEPCTNTSSENGDRDGQRLSPRQRLLMARRRAQKEYASARHGFGLVESVGAGPTYSINSLLSGFCIYISQQGVLHAVCSYLM